MIYLAKLMACPAMPSRVSLLLASDFFFSFFIFYTTFSQTPEIRVAIHTG
jgi:hypothetical protein